MGNAQDRIEKAREAIEEARYALESIEEAIESAEEEARETLETNHEEEPDYEPAPEAIASMALETVDIGEALSIVKGQAQDIGEAL